MVNASKYICLPPISANLIFHLRAPYNSFIFNVIRTQIEKHIVCQLLKIVSNHLIKLQLSETFMNIKR